MDRLPHETSTDVGPERAKARPGARSKETQKPKRGAAGVVAIILMVILWTIRGVGRYQRSRSTAPWKSPEVRHRVPEELWQDSPRPDGTHTWQQPKGSPIFVRRQEGDTRPSKRILVCPTSRGQDPSRKSPSSWSRQRSPYLHVKSEERGSRRKPPR